jgi:hypothetical protein
MQGIDGIRAELEKQARKADAIDKERGDLLRMLMKHPGWKVYQELLSAQMQIRADQILSPAGSVDGMVALEYTKGALAGLVLAGDLPSVTIAAAEELRKIEEDEK